MMLHSSLPSKGWMSWPLLSLVVFHANHFTYAPKITALKITTRPSFNHKRWEYQLLASIPAYRTLSLRLQRSQHYDHRIVSWWSFDVSTKLVAVKPYHGPLGTPFHQLLDLFIKHHLNIRQTHQTCFHDTKSNTISQIDNLYRKYATYLITVMNETYNKLVN